MLPRLNHRIDFDEFRTAIGKLSTIRYRLLLIAYNLKKKKRGQVKERGKASSHRISIVRPMFTDIFDQVFKLNARLSSLSGEYCVVNSIFDLNNCLNE